MTRGARTGSPLFPIGSSGAPGYAKNELAPTIKVED